MNYHSRHWISNALLVCVGLVAARAQVSVTTYHNDNARTGQNLSETLLTPANVNASQFAKLFVQPVDGYIYAQPLYVSNLQIGGVAHNVVFIATEHDSVYAFDADNNMGTNAGLLWHTSFINPAAGINTINSTDTQCDDLVPEVGITGTPVIDLSSKTLYVVANTNENGTAVQRLHALDLISGTEKFGGPVQIQAVVPGFGVGNSGGQLVFNALWGNQRPGLLLVNGLVYIAWASHCDLFAYHGWVMAYNAKSLAQVAVWNASANGYDAGIWQSGAPPSADSSGNVFLATGNGSFDLNLGGSDAGDTIVKLAPPKNAGLPVADYFTPHDQSTLSAHDSDLGSGGVLLLPDLPAGSPHQHLLAEIGKEGSLYLVDRDAMGHFNASGDTQIVQWLPSVVGGVFSTPAYWNNTVYVGGSSDALKAFSFNANNSGVLSVSPVSSSPEAYAYPGPTPSVSSSANTNGIVWALEEDAYQSGGSAVLRAYDATNLAIELYNSTTNAQDAPGPAVKFAVPTIAHGRVYVGTSTQLAVYGLTASPPEVPLLLSPANGAVGVSLAPSLTWAPASGAASYQVFFGTSSPPPQVASMSATSYSPGTLNGGTRYYWSVAASNQFGAAPSAVWSFTTQTCPQSLNPAAVYLDDAGQSATVSVSASAQCSWTASAGGAFIRITSGTSGTGNGSVTISVPANNTGAALNGSLTIGALSAPVTQRATADVFTDVNPAEYYFDFVNLLYDRGITAGCLASPLEYCPDATSTRGQMAVFIITAVEGGSNFTYTTTPYFTDVPATNPFFKFIQKMKDLGITAGCTPTAYCPDDPVTRGEMAVFIIKARYGGIAFSYPTTPYFTDVPPSNLYFPFVQKMAQAGITAGCEPGLYCPDSSLIRGQMAVFIVSGLLNQLLPPGTPFIASAAPGTALPGQSVVVHLSGVNTHFVQGSTQVTLANGVTPSNVTVTGSTALTVLLTVNAAAAPGPYSIVVTTGAEEAVLPNGFTVQ